MLLGGRARPRAARCQERDAAGLASTGATSFASTTSTLRRWRARISPAATSVSLNPAPPEAGVKRSERPLPASSARAGRPGRQGVDGLGVSVARADRSDQVGQLRRRQSWPAPSGRRRVLLGSFRPSLGPGRSSRPRGPGGRGLRPRRRRPQGASCRRSRGRRTGGGPGCSKRTDVDDHLHREVGGVLPGSTRGSSCSRGPWWQSTPPRWCSAISVPPRPARPRALPRGT